MIQSLRRTLHEGVRFDDARVTSLDCMSYPILRFEEVPDSIEVVLVNNRPEHPCYGAGKPSTNRAEAVIGNAVFDATGVRLRQTPFRPGRVKAVISSWGVDRRFMPGRP